MKLMLLLSQDQLFVESMYSIQKWSSEPSWLLHQQLAIVTSQRLGEVSRQINKIVPINSEPK